MRTKFCRSEDDDEHNNHFPTLYVFELQRTTIGKERARYLIYVEYIATDLYVLLNYDELKPYIR